MVSAKKKNQLALNYVGKFRGIKLPDRHGSSYNKREFMLGGDDFRGAMSNADPYEAFSANSLNSRVAKELQN